MISALEIYHSKDNQVEIKVNLDQDTVWLSQSQMVELFDKNKRTISEHINNVYKEGELDRESTVRNFRTVQTEGNRQVTRQIEHFNLDVIISVGYRVKSQRGTQFRQWASQRLKDYLVQGYAINEKRLAQKQQEVQTLKDGIRILSRAIEDRTDEPNMAWLRYFAKGLTLLDDYDHEQLDSEGFNRQRAVYPPLSEYYIIIESMKANFESEIFGKEKDGSFQSAVSQISKGFGEKDFYSSLEEKAATLLYLIIKNHAFVDGNKRIAAACFLLFLEKNKLLTNSEGEKIISNEALASLTLFVAASMPDEMTTVKKLIVSVLNRNQT